MSAFKGTPGPWEVVNGTDIFTPLAARNGAGAAAHERDGWHIADCRMGETQTEDGAENIPHREQLANARLIAAAPELLEALMQLVERISYYAELKEEGIPNIEDWAYTYNSGDMQRARAAIAKATGGAA